MGVAAEGGDVASHPAGATQSVANDATGIKTLVEQLRAVKPMLIVLEATGGIERSVVRALVAAELPVTVTKRQLTNNANARLSPRCARSTSC